MISGQIPILIMIDMLYYHYVRTYSDALTNWASTEEILKDRKEQTQKSCRYAVVTASHRKALSHGEGLRCSRHFSHRNIACYAENPVQIISGMEAQYCRIMKRTSFTIQEAHAVVLYRNNFIRRKLMLQFPKGFYFGSATSATQARGHNPDQIGERRVGKECRIGCRSRWSPYH